MITASFKKGLSGARTLTTLCEYFSWKTHVLCMRTIRNFNHRRISISLCKLIKKENYVWFLCVISSFYTCKYADLTWAKVCICKFFVSCLYFFITWRYVKFWQVYLKTVMFLNGRFTSSDDQYYSRKICNFSIIPVLYFVKNVCILSYFGPYFPTIGLNKDQDNFEYGHFSREYATHILQWWNLAQLYLT